MRGLRDTVMALAILAGTIAGVGAATMGIVALVVPASVTVGDQPTPAPSFDVGVAPTAIGGRLTISGDRTGTMEFDTASGTGGRYEVEVGGDSGTIGSVSPGPVTDPTLRGPNGRMVLDRDTADIKVIEFDDLAFYLDPGQCTVTEGAINAEAGLMAARVDCPGIADVRGRGTVNVAGTVALPIETIRGRGDLPPSGGSLVFVPEDEVDGGHEISVSFDEAEFFLGGEPNDDGRITSGSFTPQGGLAVEYDPASGEFYVTQVAAGDYYAISSEPCPIATRDLGRISETTRVVELEIDCGTMTDGDDTSTSVRGTIVADIIEVVPNDDGA